MNPKISVLVICVEAITYLLYNLHDYTLIIMTHYNDNDETA